jgi:hypothetical protein
MAFVGPRPAGMGACHFPDRNPLNCRLENLRWGTQLENMKDQAVHGTRPGGEKHHNAKLTNAQVITIKTLAGTASQRELGRRFKVTQSCISAILSGKKRTESSHAGRGLANV